MIARLALAAVLLVALPAAKPVPRKAAAPADWTRTVRPTPSGGRLVGNPAAPVKLIEFAAYTCPHCAHFAHEAAGPLAQAIRSGRLAVEYRPIVFNQIDMAATIITRCVPAPRFSAVHDALFAQQDSWSARAREYAQVNAGELRRYSAIDQLQEIAVQGGITAVAGLTPAQAAACFGNPQLVAATARATDAASAVASSTPTFIVAGRQITGVGWAELREKLRAAGLK